MYEYFHLLPETRPSRFFQITCACFITLIVCNTALVYSQAGNFNRLASHSKNAQTRVNKLKGSNKQSPPSPYSPRNRNLEYIFHPNGRSVQFAPPEGQLLNRGTSGRSNPINNFFVIPEVQIICSADGICGPPRAPAPAAILRGPTSTGSSSNARFASYSASLSYQKPGTFRVLVPRRPENIHIIKPTVGLSPTTSAPAALATGTLPVSTAAPAEKVVLAGSPALSAVLSIIPKSDQYVLPKSNSEFEVMLRTLFGW